MGHLAVAKVHAENDCAHIRIMCFMNMCYVFIHGYACIIMYGYVCIIMYGLACIVMHSYV